MKTQNVMWVVVLLLLIGCQKEDSFSLSGVTNNFKDGEKLYLRVGSEIVDSTKVTNNTFQFNTTFDNFPVRAILTTKGYRQYRFLWLEDAKIYFDASKESFRKAKVTGSESERLSSELSEQRALLPRDAAGNQQRVKLEQDFVKNHPSSIVSANILSVYASTWGKKTTQELYEALTDNIKNTIYGKEVHDYIQLAVEPKVGDSYVNFTMSDVEGNQFNVSDYKGKVVLLEFWASWCGPCRVENPNLIKTYNNYHPKGFDVIGISLDESKKNWLNAIKKDGLPWKQISDLKGDKNKAAIVYGIAGIPDNFLIDENGIIIARNLRGEKLNKKLEEIFKK